MQKRDISYDIIRALCILWIVGFHHLKDYTSLADCAVLHKICTFITVSVLACFIFISGYFLKKYKINSGKDVAEFYRRRLKRFYILYFLAAVILYFQHWFTSPQQFWLTLTGLTTFDPPPAPTLWYMSMLMFFYILTPLILSMRTVWTKIVISGAIYLILGILFYSMGMDPRMLIYYPFYILGLICPSRFDGWVSRLSVGSISAIFMLYMALFASYFYISYPYFIWLLWMTSAIFGILIIVYTGKVISRNYSGSLLLKIGYASMAMYLFHRIFYNIYVSIVGPEGGNYIFIMVPLVIIFSFYIQKAYDHCLNKLTRT